jgi:hypothetical protein
MSTGGEANNYEIFLWALHKLGGSDAFIDIEDVFLKCFEIAPQRFAWRTQAQIPDYKKCSKALRDAEAKRPALLVKTGDSFGRQLTIEGQEWISANADRLAKLLETGRVIQEPKQRPRSRLLSELERSDSYEKWLSDGTLPSEKWRIAELLRCSPDSDKRIWAERLQVLRSAAYAADKMDVLRFIEQVAESHPEWFLGGTA